MRVQPKPSVNVQSEPNVNEADIVQPEPSMNEVEIAQSKPRMSEADIVANLVVRWATGKRLPRLVAGLPTLDWLRTCTDPRELPGQLFTQKLGCIAHPASVREVAATLRSRIIEQEAA